MTKRSVCLLAMLVIILNAINAQAQKGRVMVVSTSEIPRIEYGTQQLSNALNEAGYTTATTKQNMQEEPQHRIVVGMITDDRVKAFGKLLQVDLTAIGKEGFTIKRNNIVTVIAGGDASGVLYGCLELAERIQQAKALPAAIDINDKPQMVLRGTCIGIQKPYYLPGRTVYEYPYTPETFPWLYDKKLWLQYLDTLAANRYNSLYLWNGHPFASLVRLKDYPYAVEVDDATFKKNEEMYRFLTTEADKRGIWVIQMFYNIIVSKPFAEKHGIKTQDRERPIIPLIADYTRKSIAAFVEKYPNVGLLVCLGEAMEGVGRDDIEWFTKTIIPGVRDGLQALGRKDEPPIVLRAHDTDAPAVMKEALPLYKNLYTEAKYNGEALTTYTPRGPWAELHRTLSRIGTVQIENVHILANLEPFRYGSADFIQKSVQAMHAVYEANGLHLYPQASYWDWPYAADSAQPKLLQVERDWLWYREWARYAWNSNRDRAQEINYWAGLLAVRYGCSINDGKKILEAYEESGEIAPKLLRRFGITDGNRQTLTLGMTMPQLVNPNRFGLFTLLYNSEGPEGEMLSEYAAKEWQRQSHTGETPAQVIVEVKVHGQKALEAITSVELHITRNKEDFLQLKNDMLCYHALANHYAYKAQAALDALRYKYSNRLADLEKVVAPLEQSVQWYRKLTDHTKGTYRYANSMQTQQRKIPFRGVNATYKEWWEVLPEFEKELSQLKKRIDSLGTATAHTTSTVNAILKPAAVTVTSNTRPFYQLMKSARPFADSGYTITNMVPELQGLSGITTHWGTQAQRGSHLTFSTARPVKLLVGFFQTKAPGFLPAPELETNATANDYGQADVKIANAVILDGLPPVNIHTYSFKAGTHSLSLAKGACLLLGFIDDKEPLRVYDAALQVADGKKEVDWIFE
jgi:hypothetical protein